MNSENRQFLAGTAGSALEAGHMNLAGEVLIFLLIYRVRVFSREIFGMFCYITIIWERSEMTLLSKLTFPGKLSISEVWVHHRFAQFTNPTTAVPKKRMIPSYNCRDEVERMLWQNCNTHTSQAAFSTKCGSWRAVVPCGVNYQLNRTNNVLYCFFCTTLL